MQLEQFLDMLGITVVITQRDLPIGNPTRYFAKEGPCVAVILTDKKGNKYGTFGNGRTPDRAMFDLAKQWSNQKLEVQFHYPTKRDAVINAPELHYP